MIALAIDTSGRFCSACIYDAAKQKVLAQISEDIGKGHDERLMAVIAQCMADAKVDHSALERIITSIGPGSFTGIRVGVATARGFGLGLAIPVIGVSCLDALLYQLAIEIAIKAADTERQIAPRIVPRIAPRTAPMGAIMPAGRGEVYCQFSFDNEFAEANAPVVGVVEQLIKSSLLKTPDLTLCGEGADLIDQQSGINIAISARSNSPAISTIAKLGSARQPDGTRPEPLYLRKPDAKPQHGFAIERVPQ